ncbi:M20/M25/M40 family metallo-hydrolase [Colwellia sp. UCD-KL20]|uniref:M20/M25/M40 family metallo-hydrolase n=1 Tax=Colwellia sp. UCD-KL20 TaxID=1917165 RepID=UPI000971363F|nr:M20/M25/M40 family metallo-hydrolase [Colwellia sp. UCD-KL20]
MFNNLLKIGLFSIAFISTAASADILNAKEQKQIMALKETALTSELSYNLIESLTTEVGHRLVGSEGDKKSITWALNKMKALGFDKVWTEDVTATYWHRGEVEAKVIAPYPHKVIAIALGGSVGTGDKGVKGKIAHFNTFKDLEAAADNSLNGKVVFISYRMERHINGKGYGPAVAARKNGAAVAAKKGASAIIIRSIGTDNNRLAHTGSVRYDEGGKAIPAASISNPDADMLLNQLKRSDDVEFFLKLTSHSDPKVVAKTANVIGELTGSEFPDEYVTLGAHLDSWDVGTGAVDDGIGVGMMMATVHHIAQLPVKPKRSIRVILFAAEEIGLVGAKTYVEKRNGDMAGHVIGAEWDFGVGPIYEMKTGVGKKSLPALYDFAKYLEPLGVSVNKTNTAKAQSDMSLMSQAGMPSVNFAPDGSLYFDYHHTENDTLDKVDAKALKHNTAIYTMFAYFAAQSGVNFSQ